MISISMPDFCNIVLSAYDVNYWGTQWIKISDKITPTLVMGYWETYWSGSVIWNPVDSTDWYTAPASIKMVEGVFYIQIQATLNGGGLYNGKIQQCIIPAFTIQCPTLLS